MKQLKSKIGLLTATLFLSILVVNAQPQRQGRANDGRCPRGIPKGLLLEKHVDHMQEVLNLSDEQKTQLEKLRLEHQKQMLPLRNELKEKEARLETLQTADKADMKAINAVIDEIGQIKTKMAKARAAHHQDIRNLLTEEQRIKFDMQTPRKGACHGRR